MAEAEQRIGVSTTATGVELRFPRPTGTPVVVALDGPAGPGLATMLLKALAPHFPVTSAGRSPAAMTFVGFTWQAGLNVESGLVFLTVLPAESAGINLVMDKDAAVTIGKALIQLSEQAGQPVRIN